MESTVWGAVRNGNPIPALRTTGDHLPIFKGCPPPQRPRRPTPGGFASPARAVALPLQALGPVLLHATRAPLTADAPLEPDYQGQPLAVGFGIKSTEKPSETAHAASVLIRGTCLDAAQCQGYFRGGSPQTTAAIRELEEVGRAYKQADRTEQARCGRLRSATLSPPHSEGPLVHRAHPQQPSALAPPRSPRSRPGNARDETSGQGGEAKRSRPPPTPARPSPPRPPAPPVPGTSPWSRARRPPRPGRRRLGAPSSPPGAASSSGCASLSPGRTPPARHGHLGRQSAVSGRRAAGNRPCGRPGGPLPRPLGPRLLAARGRGGAQCAAGTRARGPAHRAAAVRSAPGSVQGAVRLSLPPAPRSQGVRSRWIQLIKTLGVPTAPRPALLTLMGGGGGGGDKRE